MSANHIDRFSSQSPQPNNILHGTTFANDHSQYQTEPTRAPTPKSTSGPQINGKPTTLTVFTPTQLLHSPLLPSLYTLINLAFNTSHEKNNNRLKGDRLQYQGQLHDELGSKPGTFTWVVSYSGTHTAIATATVKRHSPDLKVVEEGKDTTWKRLRPIDESKMAWELSTMVVDPSLQGQGLAGLLMRLAEEEVKAMFVAERSKNEGSELILVITTVKEIHERFYAKRGFRPDYEIEYPKGHHGAEDLFTVIFMSKELEV